MEKLTRDSEIYNRAMRNKIINQSDFESQFKELVGVKSNIKYECEISWKSLDDTYTFRNISPDRLKSLQSMDKKELAKKCGKRITSHTWKATGDARITLRIYYRVSLPDSDEVVLRSRFSFNNETERQKVGEFVELVTKGSRVSVEITDEEYYIKTKTGISKDAEDVHSWRDTNNTDFHKRLITYLRSNSRYMKAKIGDLEHDESRVYVPIKIGEDVNIKIPFDNPESNQKFWSVVDEFGNGDPILVPNSEVYVCFDHLDVSSSPVMTDGMFNIHAEPKSSIVDRLVNLFRF